MKKQIAIATLGLTLTLGSCSKSFLDLTPVSEANTASFYQTASDINNALSATYGALQFNGQYGQYYVLAEIPSDDTRPVLSGSVTDQDEFDKFYLRTTNPFILNAWTDGFRGIARCNTVIERVQPVAMNEDLKKRYTAEAKFLRALMYFNLVRFFGGVPLVLTEIKNPDDGYTFARASAADVYTQIVKDLTDAEGVLPASYTGADVGRATRGAAKSLLGKVYMTQQKYPEAAAKLKEVVDAATYDLLPNYADVFRAANKNHKESIFDVQYKKGLSPVEGMNLPNVYAPENSGNAVVLFGGGGNNQPQPDLINSYEAGDVRKDISLGTSYTNASGAKIDYNFIKKYSDIPNINGDSENNFPVLRYADILLLYAEALNETGKTTDALPLLNRVRKRVGLADKAVTTQADMRLALEQERRVELAFEGQRWFDLVRTGRALPVLQVKTTTIGIKTALTANNLVFAVPQSQIDINPEKIKQNPGY